MPVGRKAHFLYSHAGSSIAVADAGWNEWGLHSKSLGMWALRPSSVPFSHASFLRLGFDVFDFLPFCIQRLICKESAGLERAGFAFLWILL